MATASSVQREPSMEEILASIRRIIEDNDTVRKQPDEADDLLQDLASVAMPASATGGAARQAGKALPEAGEAAPEVGAFRAELRPGFDARKAATLAEVQAPPSGAEPAVARMEPPIRSGPAPLKAPVTLAGGAVPAPAAKPDALATETAAETTDSIVSDWRREIAAVGEAMNVAKPDGTPDRAEFIEDAAESAFEPEPPRSGLERPAANEASSTRPAILSEHTGRQVAAAFGELSDAFASRSKKTFDEMAEEMLRPMLQDWLDNNLPTLVERLVREEIERVARGAQ
ncbi:cell pole-organizing protein PopZ [Mesorhizobium robiniae]|uniref:Cell pole-organizing protein PopZ n=1 Tax=Mesorhizobium robiniae TaxID=559315 RepID=A0ABV2GN33_9HYPH